MSDRSELDRREFLKVGAAASAGLALGAGSAGATPPEDRDVSAVSAASMIGVPFEKHDIVRIGIVGTGLRGRSVLHELLGVENVRITALCDVVPDKAAMALDMVRKAGQTDPAAMITSGDRGFEELVRRDDIDI